MMSTVPSPGQPYVPRVALLAQHKAAVRNAEREAEKQLKMQLENNRINALNRKPWQTGPISAKRELAPVKDRPANAGK